MDEYPMKLSFAELRYHECIWIAVVDNSVETESCDT